MFEYIDELEQLECFRSAYFHAIGQRVHSIRKSERPDFICKRVDGSLLGVEFTVIARDPESAIDDNILCQREFMDGLDGVNSIEAAITNKGVKRSEATWQLADSSILVLSTPDCPISEIEKHFNREEILLVCKESGFSEVWIADHTEAEAYGTIELFCLWPEEGWGHYPRPWTGKPYG